MQRYDAVEVKENIIYNDCIEEILDQAWVSGGKGYFVNKYRFKQILKEYFMLKKNLQPKPTNG